MLNEQLLKWGGKEVKKKKKREEKKRNYRVRKMIKTNLRETTEGERRDNF